MYVTNLTRVVDLGRKSIGGRAIYIEFLTTDCGTRNMKYIHLDRRTKNMIPIYLESELHFLNHKNIFVDGTFSVCRNVEFNQIYIFSVNIQNSTNTKTFSYPFLKFLMIKRSKNNYIQILSFCKKIYYEKFTGNLTKTIKASNILNRQNNLAPVVTTEEDLEVNFLSSDENSSDENSSDEN